MHSNLPQQEAALSREQQRQEARSRALETIRKLDAEIAGTRKSILEKTNVRCPACGKLRVQMLERKLDSFLKARSRFPGAPKS